jgi:hypothetical protein
MYCDRNNASHTNKKEGPAMSTTYGPKYPNVTVRLIGEDGNAFNVIGKTCRALRKAGLSDTEVKAFTDEATSGDYDNLLGTVMNWVDVE